MAYSELIKNFDNIRSYMRDFFIYGFKTRDEYDKKSARSYDNERRRIQSYLGELISFNQNASGKNMFISLDGRSATHNPLYRAFKSKSFTNKDITLHFIVMDILSDAHAYTLKELLEIIDVDYLSSFDKPINFDESTLRKKLKEYEELGLVISEKEGRTVRYKIVEDEVELEQYREAIRFFSEENPLGVVGSCLEDKLEPDKEYLAFKNHYIMNAYDTEIIEAVMQGIYEKRQIEIVNFSRRGNQERSWQVIPLKLYVSTQGGRNYLLCMGAKNNQPLSFRIDYIQKVTVKDVWPAFDKALEEFEKASKHMWGVICTKDRKLEHIEIDIYVGPGENFIIRRLRRERRCGIITRIDDETYRFSADVFDAYEMVPWIRTFFGRIKAVRCNNAEVVNQLKHDIVKIAKQYEVL